MWTLTGERKAELAVALAVQAGWKRCLREVARKSFR